MVGTQVTSEHKELAVFSNKTTYLDECMEFCETVKYVAETWDWQDKPNSSGQLVATSALLDQNFVTIQGLRLYGRYHLGADTGFEYIHLGINLLSGFRSRICGLDVHPEHERSHFDTVHKSIYGPHFHIGDHKKVSVDQHSVFVLRGGIEIENLPRWVDLFKEKARVLAHNKNDIGAPPFDHDLLGPVL